MEIEVLQDSLEMYKQDLEKRINSLEKGAQMENKSGLMQENSIQENAMIKRLDTLENALRRIEMEPAVDPKTDDNSEFLTYMRTGQIETKSISSEGPGGIKVNNGLIGKIFDGIKNQYSLLKNVNLLETNNRVTTLNVIDEDVNSAKFIEEGRDWADSFTPTFKSVDVKLKTCLSIVDIPRSLLEDMDNNSLLDWVNQRVINDFGNVINTTILTGNDSMEKLLADRAEKHDVAKNNVLADLLSMLAKLPDQYLSDAAWYMSSEVFKDILASDKEMIKHITTANGKDEPYRLFGKPLFFINLPEKQILFANLKEGYTMLKHSNVTFNHTMSEAFAEKTRYVYRMRLGGAITNKQAIIYGEFKAPAAPAAAA